MSIRGTAREHFENRHYDKLVKKYDEHTAKALIKGQLDEAGISLSDFDTYKKVKHSIQNGALNVKKAHKEAQEEAYDVITNVYA